MMIYDARAKARAELRAKGGSVDLSGLLDPVGEAYARLLSDRRDDLPELAAITLIREVMLARGLTDGPIDKEHPLYGPLVAQVRARLVGGPRGLEGSGMRDAIAEVLAAVDRLDAATAKIEGC